MKRRFDCGQAVVLAMARRQLAPAALTNSDEREARAWAHDSVSSRLLRVEHHVQRGAGRAARREADQLRLSLAARFLALYTSMPAFHADRPDLPQAERLMRREERASIYALGLEAIGRMDKGARANVRAKQKGYAIGAGAQYRPIFSFDWLDQARQRLLRTCLTPFVDFHPSQYMLRHSVAGRGRSAVCENILRVLPRLNEVHVFVQLDVSAFHASISHAWLEDTLPLPKAIIRSQVHTGGMTIVPLRKNVRARLGGAYDELGRRGIPSGSALSVLVGEYVVAEVLRGLADRLDAPLLHACAHNFHTYSDNIGVFVERGRADAIVDLLREAFAASPAGPFSLRAAPAVPIDQPFRFLGYWFRKTPEGAEAFVPEAFAYRRLDALAQDLLCAGPEDLVKIELSIGVQKGPPIGVQKGPPSSSSVTG
ncbi:hypothetical protein ACH0BU_13610, partial [Sphingomonas olei]